MLQEIAMHGMSKFLTVAVLLALPLAGLAAEKASADPGITHEQADAILKELKQIRALLERGAQVPAVQPAPAPEPILKANLKLGPEPVLGSKDAPVTMVEFTDYQCSFCRQFHLTTFGEIRKKYIDTGKIRFVSYDLPLEFHGNAFLAAEAARCAGDQGQFWKMRDTLINNAATLAPDNLIEYAQALYLDIPKFRACLDSHKYKETIRKDLERAALLKVDGTPTFVIGKSTPEGVDGTLMVGAQPFAAFESRLKELFTAATP